MKISRCRPCNEGLRAEFEAAVRKLIAEYYPYVADCPGFRERWRRTLILPRRPAGRPVSEETLRARQLREHNPELSWGRIAEAVWGQPYKTASRRMQRNMRKRLRQPCLLSSTRKLRRP